MKSAHKPAPNNVDHRGYERNQTSLMKMDMHKKNYGISAFPKATRSSRARGDSQRRSNNVNDCSENMCFFELLASVAGQVLEEERKYQYKRGSCYAKLSPARSSKESVGEKDAVCNFIQLTAAGKQRQAQEVVSNYTEKRCLCGTVNLGNGKGFPDMEKIISNFGDPVVGLKQACPVSNEDDVAERGEEEIDVLDHNCSPLSSSSSEGRPVSKQSEVQVNAEETRCQETSCPKVIDEDQNSSESTVFKMVSTKSCRMSKASKSLNDVKMVAMKRKASSSGVKRKHSALSRGQIHDVMHVLGNESRYHQQKQENSFPDLAADNEDAKFPASKLHRVKLSIKSFLVPELAIDLPESATVANLKRAVMEAAVNLLGGGLDVRVFLHGNKILDETVTLLGAGISSNEHSDSLSFMLEPATVGQAMTWYPGLSSEGEGNASGLNSIQDTKMVEKKTFGNKEDGYDSNEVVMSGTCALIVSQAGDALAVVPFEQNTDNLRVNKRRARRPFSVAEVEALVQAVEKLGTGRWRDVKLHAFGESEHRTYVDLKDKWKTLVHTASIAPYQRRGEPVPQQLLDRVTNAHAYWTAHQAIKAAD